MKTISFALVLTAVFVLGVLGVAQTGEPTNQVAIHDNNSPQYDSNCLASGCHQTMLQDEKTLDPRIPGIHNRMIPYVPGYNPRNGATNDSCLHCHRSADVIQGSQAALRKNVSPQACAVCHTAAGPAKELYK